MTTSHELAIDAAGPALRGLGLTLALHLIGGCSSALPTADRVDGGCLETTAQALVNGAAQESYLGLAPSQIRAIVQIVEGTASSNPALCSGTLIAPGWVITAGHCLAIPTPEIVFRQGESMVAHRATKSVRHPSRDVALFQFEPPPPAAGEMAEAGARLDGTDAPAPIAVPGAALAIAPADVVELAGYGETETGEAFDLRFLPESVVHVDDQSITVSGFGQSGACAGDSGGPLLVRARDGAPVVAGVASFGSASCRDDDTYARLDGLVDWVTGIAGPAATDDRPCGGISEAGRCLYGSALWCSGGTLVSQPCGALQHCGWDPGPSGFRCVEEGRDPCAGVDSVGACRDNQELVCNSGALVREDCGPCSSCRIDGRTGRPHCVGDS